MMKIASVLLLSGVMTGCANFPSKNPPIWVWPDMKAQEKYKSQAASPFFADGRASRRPVEGTIAVGQLKEDGPYTTGMKDGSNPVSTTPEGRTNSDVFPPFLVIPLGKLPSQLQPTTTLSPFASGAGGVKT